MRWRNGSRTGFWSVLATSFSVRFHLRRRQKPWGQWVRTQTQQHQGLGFGQARWSKAVLLLKLFHGVTGRRSPIAIGLVVEEAGFSERLLYFLHPRRLYAHLKVMVDVPVVPHAHVLPARAGSSLLLLCRQPDVGHQKRRQGDQHGPANPSPAMGGNNNLFHINAEYQPETLS